jgi:hypothetical protein
MNYKKRLVMVFLVLLVAGSIWSQAAQTYYVSAKGNDSNDGRTEAKPFKTLQKAVDMSTAGVIRTITIVGKLDDKILTKITNAGSQEILMTSIPDPAGAKAEAATAKAAVTAANKALVEGQKKYTKLVADAERAKKSADNPLLKFAREAADQAAAEKKAVDLAASATSQAALNKNMEDEVKSLEEVASKAQESVDQGLPVVIATIGRLEIDAASKVRLEKVIINGSNGIVSAGTLVVGEGVQIKGAGVKDTNGIRITGGSLTLQGDAKITNTQTGVQIDKGTVIIKDTVQISNCKGSGVSNLEGTLTVQGNAKINSNYVGLASTNVTVVKENAEISGNAGCGIFVGFGTLTLQGSAKIINNNAPRMGGGIYVNAAATDELTKITVTIQDNVLISGNTAGERGGGIYNNGGIIQISGGTITENTAAKGGGIYTVAQRKVEGDQSKVGPLTNTVYAVTMTGGTISKNKADYGAGVYAISGEFDTYQVRAATAAELSAYDLLAGRSAIARAARPTVATEKTGKKITPAAFTFTGGSITGNAATSVGGGVYREQAYAFTQGRGTLSGNTSGDGGGSENLFTK